MSGHNKWSQIKNRKGATDKKRGQIFSKLSKAITIAAKSELNPQFNPTLRSAIEKAKENQVPQNNIERAVKRASEAGENLEELLIEAYGPGGTQILIEAITDSRNRTVAEVKKILKDHGAKWADPGSVIWAFSSNMNQHGTDADQYGNSSAELRGTGPKGKQASYGAGAEQRRNLEEEKWTPKFLQPISGEDKEKLEKLMEALDNHDDVDNIVTNADL